MSIKLLLQIFTIFAVFNIILTATNEDGTYCTVDKTLDGTTIHTSKGEQQQYALSKYFSGFNLNYEIKFDKTPKSNIKVIQGVQLKAQAKQSDDHKILIGQDMIVENNGDIIFAVMAEDIHGQYVIRFGSGTKTSAPVFDEKDIVLPDESNVTCFGVTLISSTVAVADCVKYNGAVTPPMKNHYVIVSKSGSVSQYYEELNDCWLYSDPLGRKTIRYETSHKIFTQTFLIQYIPYDMDIGEGDPEGYINVFRFIYTSSEEFLNGHLEVNAPITAETLGLKDSLQIVGIQTLGDYIFLLDRYQGLVVFRYRANKVQNVRHYFYGDRVERFGMGVNYAGSYIQIVFAEKNSLVEYTINNLESDLNYQGKYKVENSIIGSVEIQGNSSYLILIQGRLVSIHDRYEKDINHMKGQIQSAEGAKLLYSNTLYIFHLNQVANYILQDPYLEVDSYVDSGSVGVTITATSNNFENSRVCKVQLEANSVPAASKKIYATNAIKELEWTFQTSVDVQIPLEHFFVGPNMEYEVSIVEEDGQSSSHFIRYNEPTKINVAVDNEQEWKNTLIVPSSDGYIYAIHTDSKYNILIFHCKNNIFTFNMLSCTDKIAEIPFGQPVRDWDFGVWGTLTDALVVVGEDVPSLVFFYSIQEIADYKPGDQIDLIDFSEAGWGNYLNVIDVDIHFNTLYTILESKSERFVGITSKVTDKIQHRNTITDDDIGTWPQVDESSTFQPTQLVTSEFHEDVIFVVNGDEVFVISVQEHVGKFLDYIPIDTAIKCDIFANDKAFVVTQADNMIVDRSLFNLNWVSLYEEFQYQTYGYNFIEQFKVAHGKISGFIYILAYAKDTKDLNVLIYRTGVENIRTLYKVIEIEKNVTIDSTKKLSINAGGLHTDYVFIQYNGKKEYLRVPVKPNVQIYPVIEDGNLYVDYIDLDVFTQSWDTAAPNELVEHTISIVNSQTLVVVDNVKIAEAIGDGFYANKEETKTWTENTKQWWEGSVLNVTLTCDPDPQVCKDNISIKNIVEQDKDFSGPKGVIDIIHSRGQTFVLYQGTETKPQYYNYKIDILPDDLDFSKAKNFATISEPFEVDCDFMTPALNDDFELEYIILFCQNYELSSYAVKKIYDQSKKDGENSGMIVLDIVSNINRGQYEFFHDRLFVNFEDDGFWGGIFIYNLDKLNKQNGYNYAEVDNIIRDKTLAEYYPDLVISSFEVIYESFDLVREKQKYVKLIITDSKLGTEYPPYLRFITLDIENNFAIETKHLYEIPWRNFVDREKQFVTDSTQLQKIKIIDAEESFDEKTQRNQMLYVVMVQPSDTAIYMVEIYFFIDDGDYTQPMALDYKNTNIFQIYNNYGYHKPYPQIHVLGNAVSVAYYDTLNKRVTLAVYDLFSLYFDEHNVKLKTKYKESSKKQRLISQLSQNEENVENLELLKTLPTNVLQTLLNTQLSKQEQIKTLSSSSKITLHTLEGGIQLKAFYGILQDMPPIAFAMHLGKDDKQVKILTEDMSMTSKMNVYSFNPHTIQITTKGKDWPEQKVFFNLNSEYNFKQTGFYAKVSPDKIKVDDNKGVSGWIIALCVILGLAVLGAVGFIVYKKYFAGSPDSQGYNKVLLGNQSDAGYSLQEPTKA